MKAGRSPPRAAATAAWQASWFDQQRPLQMRAWRAVEAQHVVATMRLVDTLDEQAVLEQILETSKPPLPPAAAGKHFLLSTPFRYRSPRGSRFRPAHAAGIWYGAETVGTACAEAAYWRWRFLVGSSGLRDEELLTEHTVFAAQVAGFGIDLMATPWSRSRAVWVHPTDYSATQSLAAATRGQGLAMLRYESARDPGGACCAVLDVQALRSVDLASQQTWHCRATSAGARMIHGDDRYEWAFDGGVRSQRGESVPGCTEGRRQNDEGNTGSRPGSVNGSKPSAPANPASSTVLSARRVAPVTCCAGTVRPLRTAHS